MLTDTHCHIHESNYPLNPEETLARARKAGVQKLICVGTSEQSSREAVNFVATHDDTFAAVGVHPHEAKDGWNEVKNLLDTPIRGQSSGRADKIVAVGEIGLDYFYTHSPRNVQIQALESQIDMALQANLPIIFHVREAFDDFWPIFDNFHGIRGELHSFTDSSTQLEQGLKRGLYIGVNGISTFTKDPAQRKLLTSVPLNRLLLETDAPFLTPAPLRGKINEPAYVRQIAEFQATERGMQFNEIATKTTENAAALFAL